jgi:hypothetical protein
MKKHLVIIGIVVLFMTVGLSGCNQVNNTLTPEKNRFVGTWMNTSTSGTTNTIIFYSNGTFSAPLLQWNGNWDVKDNKLVTKAIGTNGSENIFEYTYVFSNNNSTLTITDIEQAHPAVVYIKQNKIMGDWIGKEYWNGEYESGIDRHYTFYGNGSCSFSIEGPYYEGKIFWENYAFVGEQFTFTRYGNTTYYTYSFSSDYKQLTLTVEESPGYAYILTRL